MKAPIYNKEQKEVGSIELPDLIFAKNWNADLVHQVITSLQSSRRAVLAHTKDRGEVRGGGKKPWRQKGTGRARHGSSRSPIWTGGGATFGPTSEKNFTKKVNKKMKQKALFTILSKKLKDGEIYIIDAFGVTEPKTKEVAKALPMRDGKRPGTLIIAKEGEENVIRSGRNIEKTSVVYPSGLGAEDALRYKMLVFEKEAIEEFIKQKSKETTKQKDEQTKKQAVAS